MPGYYLGINLSHERSAAIVKDGEIIVAIEQERLDRQKYSIGFMLTAPGVASMIQPPNEAIHYCLDSCGISLAEITGVIANMPGQDFAPDILRKTLPKEMADKVLSIPSHHLAHAYSAWWPSGFDECLVLVVDATGTTGADHRTESYTMYEGRGTTLTTVHSETVESHLAGLSTIGFLYEYVTRKAGFVSRLGKNSNVSHAEAGKLMGLAPFGGEQVNFHDWIKSAEDSYSLSFSPYDIFLEIAALEKKYDTGEGKPYLRPYLVDLAYKVQDELERALKHIVKLAMTQTGLKKLCIAGGVGLNSVANYKLVNDLGLEDVFVFPAASDAGIAAGLALWAYASDGGIKRPALTQATLGRPYSSDEVFQAIDQFDNLVEAEVLSHTELITRSAKALAKGNIVARFEGGSEYGPRALGHRSIIVDPTFLKMKDIINARVKFREAFRPFAPVIPLENVHEVFEFNGQSPFMLMVAPIKPELQTQIPAVTHVDGTGRIQTVTSQDNPFFYDLCHQLVDVRQGPPVLLNTSFNIAGQPIVETPKEALETFLSTDIDYMALGNAWISKRHVVVQNYHDHLSKVGKAVTPKGLPPDQPAVTHLMAKLDRALFFGERDQCPWTDEELQKLSAFGARYKETSILFPESPMIGSIQTKVSDGVVWVLNPLGKSAIVDLSVDTDDQNTKSLNSKQDTTYSFEDVKLLMAMLSGKADWQEKIRLDLRLTNAELLEKVRWGQAQLSRSNIVWNFGPKSASFGKSRGDQDGEFKACEIRGHGDFGDFFHGPYTMKDPKNNVQTLASTPSGGFKEIAFPSSDMGKITSSQLWQERPKSLAPFENEAFVMWGQLDHLRTCLQKAAYSLEEICSRLEVKSLQDIEPTRLYYYDKYRLNHDDDCDELIRLFLLRVALPYSKLVSLFGEDLLRLLILLGVVLQRGQEWSSRVDLFEVEGIYVATDHRYLFLAEDRMDESPVMYIGSDSQGLVYTAPKYSAESVVDLCCGSGIQGLVASRYSHKVVGVDLNPRAIRFSRFNAQLNGIRNIQFLQGSLYEPVTDQKFDTILANPPFVPSPDRNLEFRDGGDTGEEILVAIISSSSRHLNDNGHLFIVSDLVDVKAYQKKLSSWWSGGSSHQLVLCTADRDDVLFSVPHSHAPFGQTFGDYNTELERWIDNFHKANLKAVNFGYIFIQRQSEDVAGSYFSKTIHNPTEPIHAQVEAYFQQRALCSSPRLGDYFLSVRPDLKLRLESGLVGVEESKVELFVPENPYFTTYQVSEEVYETLKAIQRQSPCWKRFCTPDNQKLLENLISKGLLLLSEHRHHSRYGTAQHSKKSVIQDIVELGTKTTPTCLSAYLN